MSTSIPTDPLARMADLLRIGNRAARQVQQANRRHGIVNWYSLNGRLVSDAEPAADIGSQPLGASANPDKPAPV